MIYQALYRKYRPKTFDEVCGQKIIVQTLKNTIINNKLTHAYLFIGPRGTGKTSIAKIFAKTINCEDHKNGCSCEKCEICRLSNNNENVDIIEMDAASNNGVDEIREIKNHVSLMPTFSKYKIYIIDEVHMLSTGAFNALLKTLEEPPQHVIFILATTEPQKVPLTIISRCQSFEFKPIPENFMFEKIKYICDNEKINIEEDAIKQICYDSYGGMRDAISLLDQLNSYTNGNIKKEDVILLNGRISNLEINDFLNYYIDNNIIELFNMSDKYNNEGRDFTLISEDIIKYLKNSLIEYQINNKNNIVEKIGKNKVLDIIYKFTDFINLSKNVINKKIYFDLLLIKIIDINNTNNSTINIGNSIINKEKNNTDNLNKKFEENINNVNNINNEKNLNIINDKIEKNNDNQNYDNHNKLMNVRLNNILKYADKNSLNEYLEFFINLESNLDNLDERKIYNLLLDCSIKAGSKDGIIIVASNKNILYELYDSLIEIENFFINKIQKNIKLCFYLESEWEEKRKIYVNKIKNKENIDLLDEKDILDLIYKKDSNNKSEFEDLLEIGE